MDRICGRICATVRLKRLVTFSLAGCETAQLLANTFYGSGITKRSDKKRDKILCLPTAEGRTTWGWTLDLFPEGPCSKHEGAFNFMEGPTGRSSVSERVGRT